MTDILKIFNNKPDLPKPDYFKHFSDTLNTGEGQYKLLTVLRLAIFDWPQYFQEYYSAIPTTTFDLLRETGGALGTATTVSIVPKLVSSVQNLRTAVSKFSEASSDKIVKASEKVIGKFSELIADSSKTGLLLNSLGFSLGRAFFPVLLASGVGGVIGDVVELKRQSIKYYKSFKVEQDAKPLSDNQRIAVEKRRLSMLNLTKKVSSLALNVISVIALYIASAMMITSTGLILSLVTINTVVSLWARMYKESSLKELKKNA